MVLLYVLALVFCAPKKHHQFTRTIENDIDICTNSIGPKYTEPLYEIEELLSLGGEEPEPKLYQPFGDCLVDDEGNIFFSDEDRIKKFDSDGNFLQFIGRPGDEL